MFGFFKNHIEPQNKELGRALGVKQIEVTHVPMTHVVDNVYIKVGRRQLKVSEYKFFRDALGLTL